MIMISIIFLITALILHNKQGAVIALSIAALSDTLSDVAFNILQYHNQAYVYYVALFLIVFAWWIVMCRLKMLYSQIVTGMACVLMSVSVVDCYFADGYATTISAIFPFAIWAINAATIWAAWNDRNWTYSAYCNSRGKSIVKNNEVNSRC
jgi:hypothetical protein